MNKPDARKPFGRTGLTVPPVIFGTSCLGNLYQALPWPTKREVLRQCLAQVEPPVVLDCAGKYGAGLALESIGRGLRELDVRPDQVVLSNKLGWLRGPLRGPEPTFEPGVWAGLEHDAEQRIGDAGICACWEQGCALLGPYRPQLVSVHDPDEYLAAAGSPVERRRRFADILAAYRALHALKAAGHVRAVGVGAKNWQVIRELADAVELDWVMLACSYTVLRHPPELVAFMRELAVRGVAIVNSAVFHAGFLTGGRFFDYRELRRTDPDDRRLLAWRRRFFDICRRFEVEPAAACVRFGLSGPGVTAVALNTGRPDRIAQNVRLTQADVPAGFWSAMREAGLIAGHAPAVGPPVAPRPSPALEPAP